MHRKFIKKKWLYSLIKRLVKIGRLPKPASASASYEKWRTEFMKSRLYLGLWLTLILFFTFTCLELINIWLRPQEFQEIWLTNQLTVQSCILCCFLLFRLRWGQKYPSLVFLIFSWAITLSPQIHTTLKGVFMPSLLVWPLMFFGQATLMPVRWELHLVSQLGVLVYCLFCTVFLHLEVKMPAAWLSPNAMSLYMFWICFICNLSVYLYEGLQQAEFKARQELETAYSKLQAEQDRSEKLLLNILPEPIAIRLKENHQTIAESFNEVSVLFADIVGFTEISCQISAAEIVELLNKIFSAFDQLADKHGLEKIKTIGDAYMVVAGLPLPREDHAQAIANMALDMQSALIELNTETNQNLCIRIGIATGPVVAGVIGIKKFIYDLWGDTVNMASRMESHGIPGTIQVTSTTYNYLKKIYLFEERGLIKIKGKGEMETYLLVGKR